MCIEKRIRILAGTMVLLSLALGLLVSPWFFALTAFVGVNLIQSAFTGLCPAENMMRSWDRRRGQPQAPEGSA